MHPDPENYRFDYSPSIVNPRRLNTYFESISDGNNHDDLIMILLVIIMIMICQS